MFGKVSGYSQWVRKDSKNRRGGSVAACLKDGLQAGIQRGASSPNGGSLHLGDADIYSAPLDFLKVKHDPLVLRHLYSQVIVVGDLNFRREQKVSAAVYIRVQNLANHMTFPTHEQG